MNTRWVLPLMLPLLGLGCQRPEVEAFRRAPTPIVVNLSVPPDVPSAEAVSREYAAALRARLATRATVVPEGVQPPAGAAELQVTIVAVRERGGDPTPGMVGVATGVAVGTLNALAGNRNAVFEGFWWGLWAGAHTAADQRYEQRRLGYRPRAVNGVVILRQKGREGQEWIPLAEFDIGGGEVMDRVAPLGAAERDDEFRIREEEARAFARVIVERLQDRFDWALKAAPAFYSAPATPPAPAPAQ